MAQVAAADVARVSRELNLCLHGNRAHCKSCRRGKVAPVTLEAVHSLSELVRGHIGHKMPEVDAKFDTMIKFSVLRGEGGPLHNFTNVHGAFAALLKLGGHRVEPIPDSFAYRTDAWLYSSALSDDEEEEAQAYAEVKTQEEEQEEEEEQDAEPVKGELVHGYYVYPMIIIDGFPPVSDVVYMKCGNRVYRAQAVD